MTHPAEGSNPDGPVPSVAISRLHQRGGPLRDTRGPSSCAVARSWRSPRPPSWPRLPYSSPRARRRLRRGRNAVTPTASNYSGSFALSGSAAAAYVVPGDVTQVWTSRRPDGATQTRYQQRVGGADVFGGQVTVLKNAAGTHHGGHRRPLPGPAAHQRPQGRQGGGARHRRGQGRQPGHVPQPADDRPAHRAVLLPGAEPARCAAPGPLGRRVDRRRRQRVQRPHRGHRASASRATPRRSTPRRTPPAGSSSSRPATTGRRPTTCRTSRSRTAAS